MEWAKQGAEIMSHYGMTVVEYNAPMALEGSKANYAVYPTAKTQQIVNELSPLLDQDKLKDCKDSNGNLDYMKFHELVMDALGDEEKEDPIYAVFGL